MTTAEALNEARRRFGPRATVQDNGPHGSPSVRYTVKASPEARALRDGLAVCPSFDECFRRLDSHKRIEAKHAARDNDRAAMRRLRVAW